jgi:hypothetical protein
MCEIIKDNTQFNDWFTSNDNDLFMGAPENLANLEPEIGEHLDKAVRSSGNAEIRLNFSGKPVKDRAL